VSRWAAEEALRRLLTRAHLLPFDSVTDVDGAVTVYRLAMNGAVVAFSS